MSITDKWRKIVNLTQIYKKYYINLQSLFNVYKILLKKYFRNAIENIIILLYNMSNSYAAQLFSLGSGFLCLQYFCKEVFLCQMN